MGNAEAIARPHKRRIFIIYAPSRLAAIFPVLRDTALPRTLVAACWDVAHIAASSMRVPAAVGSMKLIRRKHSHIALNFLSQVRVEIELGEIDQNEKPVSDVPAGESDQTPRVVRAEPNRALTRLGQWERRPRVRPGLPLPQVDVFLGCPNDVLDPYHGPRLAGLGWVRQSRALRL